MRDWSCAAAPTTWREVPVHLPVGALSVQRSTGPVPADFQAGVHPFSVLAPMRPTDVFDPLGRGPRYWIDPNLLLMVVTGPEFSVPSAPQKAPDRPPDNFQSQETGENR